MDEFREQTCTVNFETSAYDSTLEFNLLIGRIS